jgi:hypothetical protein
VVHAHPGRTSYDCVCVCLASGTMRCCRFAALEERVQQGEDAQRKQATRMEQLQHDLEATRSAQNASEAALGTKVDALASTADKQKEGMVQLRMDADASVARLDEGLLEQAGKAATARSMVRPPQVHGVACLASCHSWPCCSRSFTWQAVHTRTSVDMYSSSCHTSPVIVMRTTCVVLQAAESMAQLGDVQRRMRAAAADVSALERCLAPVATDVAKLELRVDTLEADDSLPRARSRRRRPCQSCGMVSRCCGRR